MNVSNLALLEMICKGTAVLLAGYGGAALLRRSSAAHRSAWWLAVFGCLGLLPLALAIPPLVVWPVSTGSAVEVMSEPGVIVAGGVLAAPVESRIDYRTWLLAAYALGAAGIIGFRLLGTWQVTQLRRGSVEWVEPQATVDGWCADAGLHRHVRVQVSGRVAAPMTWGVWRPEIVLPAESREWSAMELRAALQHEFAHIRHHDAARRWLGVAVAALWWPHPLVWAARRCWKLEQERACDDAVLTQGSEAAAYAQQLLKVAQGGGLSGFTGAAALVMAMPAGLEQRLRAVVDVRTNRGPARLGALLRIGAVALAASVGTVAFQARTVVAAPPAALAVSAAGPQGAETIIPTFEVRGASVAEALRVLAEKSGMKIVYQPEEENSTQISIQLKNVPATQALRYVAELSKLSITYQADGVYLQDRAPAQGAGNPTRPNGGTIRLNGGTFSQKPPGSEAAIAPAPDAPLATKVWKVSPGFIAAAGEASAKDYLASTGIPFPRGSSAVFIPSSTRLVVKNTAKNLEAVEALVKKDAEKKPAPR